MDHPRTPSGLHPNRFLGAVSSCLSFAGERMRGTVTRKVLALLLLLIASMFLFGGPFSHFVAYVLLVGASLLLGTGALRL